MSTAFSPWQQRAYDHAVAALEAGRLGHGLLVCGPAGLGKRAVVDRLARRVLAQQRDARGEPAPNDRSAHLIEAGTAVARPFVDPMLSQRRLQALSLEGRTLSPLARAWRPAQRAQPLEAVP